ncbi:MAG: hypothetical protein ACHQRJ_18875, partial [Alphaproteobacteria bacterium]
MSELAWLWGVVHERLDDTFGVASPYGAPAVVGALLCSAFYYIQRRRARGHPPPHKGLNPTVLPNPNQNHPTTQKDNKKWRRNGHREPTANAQ